MSDQESGAPAADGLLALVQHLADTKPTEAGHSLEWAVQAYYLGDMGALAMSSLRERD